MTGVMPAVRVFIIYTVEELMEDFGCSNKTAIKLLRELEQSDLIVRQRQGLGKPSLIYVKQIQQSEEVVSPASAQKAAATAEQNHVSGVQILHLILPKKLLMM